MSTFKIDAEPLATNVRLDGAMLSHRLEDGRELSVPIAWYPRPRDGRLEVRANWRLISKGEGIHWPELDDEISALGRLGS